MDIWCKFLFNTININSNDTEYIINSKNRWEDVYMNNYYNNLISNNNNISQYLFTLFDKKYNKKKISFWYQTVNNMFFSTDKKEDLWKHFIKAQKNYYVLSNFINRVKYKSLKVKVDIDLNLNKIVLSPLKGIEIFHNGALYYFTINDLINICSSALTFSYHFFSEAYSPKNPYTNNCFTYPILLKIYFAIRYSSFKMPIIFEMFYRSNFNIKNFKKTNEFFIREECIKSFMKNASEDEHFEYIDEMLHIKDNKNIFNFEDNFPKNILVKAFKPYLFMYLISRYSLRSSRKMYEYRIMLKNSLRSFKRLNPCFGRNIIRVKKIYSFKKKKMIRIKEEKLITDFKEGQIVLPSFRQLITEIMFKDENDSDVDSDDEIDNNNNNDNNNDLHNAFQQLLTTTDIATIINNSSPLFPSTPTESPPSTPDNNNNNNIENENNVEITNLSDIDTSDDDDVTIIINNNNSTRYVIDSDDEYDDIFDGENQDENSIS